MKKQILLVYAFGFLTTLSTMGQDMIIKVNGEEVNSKVLGINNESIRYRESEFQDRRSTSINISDITMVTKENWVIEKRNPKDNQSYEDANENDILNENFVLKRKSIHRGRGYSRYNNKSNYFYIGLGYGNCYGGLIGLQAMWRIGENQRIAIHAGVGILAVSTGGSLGVKIYPFEDFFKHYFYDLQFGTLDDKGTIVYDVQNNTSKVVNRVLSYGPSVLMGYDLFFSKRKKNFGVTPGFGASYNINPDFDSKFSFALEGSTFFRF